MTLNWRHAVVLAELKSLTLHVSLEPFCVERRECMTLISVASTQGDANDYGPIIHYIKETQQTADVLAKWRM